jgi:hypothetical protein
MFLMLLRGTLLILPLLIGLLMLTLALKCAHKKRGLIQEQLILEHTGTLLIQAQARANRD